ncbi:MAG: ABC transporter permease, partial [Spirochaetaceae bacterium]|nr:ABC transporter permease [Spirochaetaceae bacterium]
MRLYETATGRIMVPGYWDDRETFPLEKSFNPELVTPVLEASGAGYAPRISFGGDLIFYRDPFPEDGSIPGRFTAIDPERDSDVFMLRDSLSEGSWLVDGEQGIILGHWLAEDIGAGIGHTVLVETQTKDGYIQVFDLEVVGIVNCPNPEITRSGMFLPLSVADEYLEMNGAVTEVNVNFGTAGGADENFAALVPEVEAQGFEALGWRILGADFIAISQAKAGGTGMIILLVLIIAGVGISNTMLMAVYERVRELGMMRALGMRDRQIRALFLWESAGIGLLGGVYGVGLGSLITWPLVKFGIDYGFLLREGSFGYRIQGQMYGVWDFKNMIFAFVT